MNVVKSLLQMAKITIMMVTYGGPKHILIAYMALKLNM